MRSIVMLSSVKTLTIVAKPSSVDLLFATLLQSAFAVVKRELQAGGDRKVS